MLAPRIECDDERLTSRLEQVFPLLELRNLAAAFAVTHAGHTNFVVPLEAFEVQVAADSGVLVFGFTNGDQMHSHGSRLTPWLWFEWGIGGETCVFTQIFGPNPVHYPHDRDWPVVRWRPA